MITIRPRGAPVLALIVGVFASGCGGPPAESPASPPKPAETKTDVKAPGDAKVGDKSTCPVSHDEFTVQASSEKSDYEGKTYYFCCGGCKAKFDADPSKYVKK